MAITDIKTDDPETARILAAAYLASLWTESTKQHDQRPDAFLTMFAKLYNGMEQATRP